MCCCFVALCPMGWGWLGCDSWWSRLAGTQSWRSLCRRAAAVTVAWRALLGCVPKGSLPCFHSLGCRRFRSSAPLAGGHLGGRCWRQAFSSQNQPHHLGVVSPTTGCVCSSGRQGAAAKTGLAGCRSPLGSYRPETIRPSQLERSQRYVTSKGCSHCRLLGCWWSP